MRASICNSNDLQFFFVFVSVFCLWLCTLLLQLSNISIQNFRLHERKEKISHSRSKAHGSGTLWMWASKITCNGPGWAASLNTTTCFQFRNRRSKYQIKETPLLGAVKVIFMVLLSWITKLTIPIMQNREISPWTMLNMGVCLIAIIMAVI